MRRFLSVMKAVAPATGSLLKPEPNRLALENFLLRRGYPQLEAVHREDDDMVNVQAQLVLCPDTDRYWMPKPLLYRKMELSKSYLDELEIVEHRLFPTQFNARLLYLQAFVHPSMAEALSLKSKLPLKETRLLTQERLVPFGDSVIQMTIMHYLLQRNPQLRPVIVKDLQAKCNENIIIGDIAKKLELDKLVLVSDDLTSHLQHDLNADVFRSLIGAVYLDQDLPSALKFSFSHFAPLLSYTMDNLLKQHRN